MTKLTTFLWFQDQAVSLFIDCEDQAEAHRLWEKRTADGGAPSVCGWLTDQSFSTTLALMRLPVVIAHVLGILLGYGMLRRLLPAATAALAAFLWAVDPFVLGYSRLLHVDASLWLPDDLLVKVDRATMAHSLEARVPYLDHEFVQACARLPSTWKLHGRTTKYILKKVAEKYLPREIVHRSKQGFVMPLTEWLAAGAPAAAPEPLSASLSQEVMRWEALMNGDTLKHRLAARYLYEHLFLAHLYLEDRGSDHKDHEQHQHDIDKGGNVDLRDAIFLMLIESHTYTPERTNTDH